MYEERKKRINWIRLFLVVIIVFLLLLLAVKIISLVKFSSPEKHYAKELETLETKALDYFNKDNIPNDVGDSIVIYLVNFKNNNIDYELNVRKNDTCDLENSYIRATRLEDEYQVKSYILCDSYEDSKITYVSLIDDSKFEETTKAEDTTRTEETTKEHVTSIPKEDSVVEKSETTTKVITKEVTTKKTTKANTTKKTTTKADTNKITIGFNTNGGEIINSISVNKGSKINLPVPVRNGYTFVGWYKNNQQYTNNYTFNESIILVAKWIKNS